MDFELDSKRLIVDCLNSQGIKLNETRNTSMSFGAINGSQEKRPSMRPVCMNTDSVHKDIPMRIYQKSIQSQFPNLTS